MSLTTAIALLVAATAPVRAEDTVVVEGERPGPEDGSAAVTVVEVDERLPASADVASVVEGVAGTTVRRFGGLGDYSAVSIRGSSFRQVQVFLDGVPLNPDGSTTVNLSELPLHAFERVEIYRGNAPPSFAAAPIGGVVNLVTGDELPGPSVRAAYGQHRTARAGGRVAGQTELAGGQTDGLVLIDALTTAGDFRYFDDNGTIYTLTDDHLRTRSNNDKLQLGAHGRVRWWKGPLQLSLLEAGLHRDEGLPGHANNPAASAGLTTSRNLAVLQADTTSGTAQLRVRGWNHTRVETYADEKGELGVGTQRERSTSMSNGLLVHGSLVPNEWVAPALTLQARRDGFRTRDLVVDAPTDPRARTALFGALSAQSWLFDDRLSVTPVVQATWLDSRVVGDGDSLASLDPRLGTRVRLTESLLLKANVGRYLRPPDLSELFGDRGAVIGNPELLPERSLQWDVGGRLALPDGPVTGALELGHFWSATRDLIVYVQNAQRTMVPINLSNTWLQGIEASARLDLAGFADVSTAVTRTLSVNLSTEPELANNQLPRVPTWEVDVGASVHLEERARLGWTWTHVSGNTWDATNWYWAPPRDLHGLFVRGQPIAGGPSLELSVLNVGDRIVQVVPRNPLDPSDDAQIVQAMTDFAGYPLAGRTWLFTLRHDFGGAE